MVMESRPPVTYAMKRSAMRCVRRDCIQEYATKRDASEKGAGKGNTSKLNPEAAKFVPTDLSKENVSNLNQQASTNVPPHLKDPDTPSTMPKRTLSKNGEVHQDGTPANVKDSELRSDQWTRRREETTRLAHGFKWRTGLGSACLLEGSFPDIGEKIPYKEPPIGYEFNKKRCGWESLRSKLLG